jgi:hypothetical protein
VAGLHLFRWWLNHVIAANDRCLTAVVPLGAALPPTRRQRTCGHRRKQHGLPSHDVAPPMGREKMAMTVGQRDDAAGNGAAVNAATANGPSQHRA